MKKTNFILLGIALFIVALNLRPAITSVAPLLGLIQNDLGISASVSSLLTTIPVFCMGLFSPLSATLANRWGIERIIGWSIALIGIGTALRVFTVSSYFLLATAFLAASV